MDNAAYHRRENVPPYKVRSKDDPPVISLEERVEDEVEDEGGTVEESVEEEDDDDQWADETLTVAPEPTKRRTLNSGERTS